jgi:hypothetical protein
VIWQEYLVDTDHLLADFNLICFFDKTLKLQNSVNWLFLRLDLNGGDYNLAIMAHLKLKDSLILTHLASI